MIRQFALKKPVARLLVNTPAAFGGMGMTSNLFPALTLGSGVAGYGITSDNVSPLHLIYTRKVGYGVLPDGRADPRCLSAVTTGNSRETPKNKLQAVQRVLQEALRVMDASGAGRTF